MSARFSNVGDLKLRAPVKVAGVTVGQVKSIRLADYYGEVELAIARKVGLPKDTIASIATAGLLGDAYVSLSPGGADANLGDGDRITRTEPALNMADIIGRYAFGGQQTPAPTSGDDKKEPSTMRARLTRSLLLALAASIAARCSPRAAGRSTGGRRSGPRWPRTPRSRRPGPRRRRSRRSSARSRRRGCRSSL